jgi:trimeric autotransporter adhesin
MQRQFTGAVKGKHFIIIHKHLTMKKRISALIAIMFSIGAAHAQWSLTGNAGTNPPTNFIGTTDWKPLVFKISNERSGIIDPENENTSLGFQCFYQNSGRFNSVFGTAALYKNSSGNSNTAIGRYVMFSNTSGSCNTAVGSEAMNQNPTGNDNTTVGFASQTGTGGNENTSVGAYSLALSAGSYNTAVGTLTLNNTYNASYCTMIGYAADFSSLSTFTNSTAIGNQAMISASNQVRIGDMNVNSIGGAVGWTTVSDGRFKSNIQSNVPGLAFIKQLKPITYTLKVSELNKHLHPNGVREINGKKITIQENDADVAASEQIVRTGFIAQDVEAAAKKVGFDFDGVDKPKNDKDLYGLRYEEFVTPLVQAVQELSNANDRLSNSNDSLKAVVTNLQLQISDIMQQIKDLKNGNTASLGSVLPVLKQNSPNPFNSNTTISYFIPSNFKSAWLIVTNASRQLLKNIPVNKHGEGQVTIQAGELAAGSYFYTLTVDGRRVDTKQMILTK